MTGVKPAAPKKRVRVRQMAQWELPYVPPSPVCCSMHNSPITAATTPPSSPTEPGDAGADSWPAPELRRARGNASQ